LAQGLIGRGSSGARAGPPAFRAHTVTSAWGHWWLGQPAATAFELERALQVLERVRSWRISSAARQAIAITGPFVFAETWVGITEQSTTRSPVTPLTRRHSSRTASRSPSTPILQVPTLW